MHGNTTRQRFTRPGLGVAICAGLSLAGSPGCSDHRISLQEFIAMEQECCEVVEAPATTQPVDTALIDEQLGPYKVGEGDVLTVTLTGLEEAATLPPMAVRVDRSGEVQLPAVGKLKVGGMELQDVEAAVHEAYVPKVYQDIVVHVGLGEPRSTRVLVTGAVTLPGLVSLRRTERNLLFAIVGAGGVSEVASGTVTLKRIRNPGEEMTFTLTDPIALRSALAIDPLQDGDVVTVNAATPNTVFVGGLVLAPRPQPYPPGVKMTVLQAIAAAGGLRTDVTPTEATLIRRKADGEDVQVKLDLDRVTKGQDPNITLAAGDVLWVPDTVLTRVQDWVNKNVFFRTGASATYNLSYDSQGLHFLNSTARNNSFGGSQNLQDSYDPFGFLLRNQALQNLGRTVGQ